MIHVSTYRHLDSSSTLCQALVLLCLLLGLVPQDASSVSMFTTKSTVKAFSSAASTKSVTAASDRTVKINVTVSNSNTSREPEQNQTTSITTVEILIRRTNCTDKESSMVRCFYGQCYVVEHPYGRDPPACQCLDFYKGPTCRILEPLPVQEDPTRPQKIVGIVVPIVALLVTGVVVFIMCRMKTRRAAMCAGGSGRNRHAVILAAAENGEATKEMKTEDTPLIANSNSSSALGAPADSNPDLNDGPPRT